MVNSAVVIWIFQHPTPLTGTTRFPPLTSLTDVDPTWEQHCVCSFPGQMGHSAGWTTHQSIEQLTHLKYRNHAEFQTPFQTTRKQIGNQQKKNLRIKQVFGNEHNYSF